MYVEHGRLQRGCRGPKQEQSVAGTVNHHRELQITASEMNMNIRETFTFHCEGCGSGLQK